MHKVVIIGYGNVGQAMASAINSLPDFEVVQIYCRNRDNAPASIPFPVVADLQQLTPADIYLLCVNDDAIREVSEMLPFGGRLVAHTSGSIPMEALSQKQRRAVCYPLQTFTRDKEIKWSEVPICVECEDENDNRLLNALAQQLSGRVYQINSDQRKKLHLAAVIVNNFVNHLYYLGETYCRENNIPFDILHPLILETALKIRELSPYEAQTGPARRNDQKTLNSQLLQLKDSPVEQIYKILTTSIIATYEREKL